tara:strand:+ start:262 stop:684 length:423 start_codon:yes stop_codon:yes gene_type:complete
MGMGSLKMANFIFSQDAVDLRGCLHRSIPEADASGFAHSYKIIPCTDDEYNSVRLVKKTVFYDASDNLVFEDCENISWNTEADLNAHIASLEDDEMTIFMKAQDFSSETFPLNKSIPELYEDKGQTFISQYSQPNPLDFT